MPFHLVALFLAIVVTPWLLSRLLLRRHSWRIILAGWGPALISVNMTVPLILHLLTIPITPDALALSHIILAAVITLISAKAGLHPGETHPCSSKEGSSCKLFQPIKLPSLDISAFLLFAILVLPLTHIAGIDTYKWQDLAGNIAVEQRISWLIHPLSLLGFTPRSYSSAQPLVLASIQILGHTGVDWGFYLLSLICGLTGFSGAWILGRYLFKSDTSAAWLAILYMFSPVFMRYNYWATGRGLLLALLPVYLLILLKLGSSLTRQRWNIEEEFGQKSQSTQRKLIWLIPAWLFMTVLLMTSHKAGVVGACLIPILFAVSPALALLRGRWGLLIAGLLAVAAGLLLVNGQPLTLAIRLVTRFGWLLPLAILAITMASDRLLKPPFRAILTAGLATLVLSCTPDMYGALLALPFIACVAALGLEQLNWTPPTPRSADTSKEGTYCEKHSYTRSPPWRGAHRAGWVFPKVSRILVPFRPMIILGVILIPAIVIVLNQMRDSPSESVYRAAQFIEQYDPRGPFRIEAPGKARHQIQAYVSGCPRFTVQSGSASQLDVHAPPAWTGKLAHNARQWIDYMRTILELRNAHTDWYGNGTKVYYVTINGQGITPQGAKLLFTSGNVSVFE